MNTIAPMIGLVARTQLAAIVSSHAVPPRDDVRVIPLENPTPVRTPGILWHRDAKQKTVVRSFAASVRKLALRRSLGRLVREHGQHEPAAAPGRSAEAAPKITAE
jgi:LysR family transcriptional regulator, cyn operon transcriptional activator